MSEDTNTRATPPWTPGAPASPVAAFLIAGALCLPACGGASPATDDAGDAAADEGGEDATAGGEGGGAADAEQATDDATDAADAGGATADGQAADGETADGGQAVADAAEADEDDAEAEGSEEAAPDPRVVWRTKVRRGRRVFERVCGVCHPGGEEDLGPSILGANLSVAEVRRQIRQGVGRMRPIPPSKLPERYMDELFAYLSTLRVVRGVPRP